MELERDIERVLIRETQRRQGVCLKVGQNGWPDRLLLLPGGMAVWAELKRRDGELAPLQLARIAKLQALGHRVRVVRSREDAEALFAMVDAGRI